jgi:hypothetical protein
MIPAHRPKYPVRNIATPVRENQLIISPSNIAGDFDSHAVDCPFVFSKNGRQGMTYVGWDGIGYQTAISWNDGFGQWSPGQLILRRDKSSELRTYNAALTSIIRENDLWSTGELKTFDGWHIGTYHAYPNAGFEAGPGSIGFVRSRDLVEWEEFGTPLRCQDGASWEQGGLYKSWLLEQDGIFYLFYNAKNVDDLGSMAVPPVWVEQTGLAISTDLFDWTRHPANPSLSTGDAGSFDAMFASDPCVLRDGEVWIMFYFGLAADGHAREGFATSMDLVSWVKEYEVLIDVGPAGSVDSIHAHKPAVIARGGKLEHYYCAVSTQIPIEIDGYMQTERRGIARATGRISRVGSN